MKANRLLNMAMAATAALAFVGCNNADLSLEETGAQAGDLVIKAAAPATATSPAGTPASAPATKISMAQGADSYSMTWDSNDKVKLISAGTAYESSAISISSDKKTAEFTFPNASGIEGDYEIFAPSSAAGVSGSTVTATIAQSQSSKATCPNGFVIKGSGTTPELNVKFDHLATYVKLNIKGLLPNETVNHVTVYLNGSNLAGDITFDEDGNPVYDGHSNDKDNIYIGTWNIGKANASGEITVWFSAKPFTISSGKTFSVKICTETETTHELALVAKKDIDCPVGTVVALPVTVPGVKYTVSFNTNGGSSIEPVKVKDGDCAAEPENPVLQLAEGLYPGAPDDIKGDFQGWYTDSGLTEAYDFSTPVTSDITLYAKWGAAPEKIDLSAWEGLDNYTVVHGAIKYANSQTLSEETHYTLVLTSNKQFWGGADGLNKENAVLHIIGQGAERKIYTSANYLTLLDVNAGELHLEKNLHIYGTNLGTHPIINLNNTGAVYMESGCRLTGSRGATSQAVVVKLNSSTCKFIMNGGEIVDNQGTAASNDQGIIYVNYGRFEMKGGVISDNVVTATSASNYVSGGVLFMGWAGDNNGRWFVKTGGEIKNNTAVRDVAEGTEITGMRGQQVLIKGGAKKKIDSNVSASQNLDAEQCYSSPWTNAVVE